ncbi:MAG: D-alanyl-D-alanine carboxypeptidase [Desulfobacterales bacterium]|jgi:D-alanyl-D-alanine carboxypeptidase/D-alanyl-D-alanine-endopeptidase (penicillin-binding protein 4)
MIDTAAHPTETAIGLFRQDFWAMAADRVTAFIDRSHATACNRSGCVRPRPGSQKTVASALVWLLMLCLLSVPAGLKAQDFSELDALIGKNDSILITDAREQILFSKNADQKRIPASILKIFTSLVALHYLGDDYRFPTEFYLDQKMNLKIKGYGDPLLISEVIVRISQVLTVLLKKSNPLNDLILDDSYFRQPLTVPGITSSNQPYDAPNGALCVNFNTVAFKRTSQGYVSAEPQTPLLPFVIKKIKASKLKAGRIVFSHHKDEISIYAGHLFQYFLKKQGIRFDGKVRLGRVDADADRLIYRYEAQTSLNQNVVRLLEYSNNFMTNQLLIATGAKIIGSPGTLTKGVTIANDYARHMLDIADMSIVEGSGISRENRVSARQMDRILQEFLPYHYYMRRAGREYYKTGTLYGISTRAGYIRRTNGQLCRYVIMLNTPGKSTEPVALRLLRILD